MKDKNIPNYKRIYTDILELYPEKNPFCIEILNKNELSGLDVINLNTIIFGKTDHENQKHKSYDHSTIIEILEYQRKYNMNNTALASHFNLSRNTVSSWKRRLNY